MNVGSRTSLIGHQSDFFFIYDINCIYKFSIKKKVTCFPENTVLWDLSSAIWLTYSESVHLFTSVSGDVREGRQTPTGALHSGRREAEWAALQPKHQTLGGGRLWASRMCILAVRTLESGEKQTLSSFVMSVPVTSRSESVNDGFLVHSELRSRLSDACGQVCVGSLRRDSGRQGL